MQGALATARHYLDRGQALAEAAPDAALDYRPAPGMFCAGEQLAIAAGFAGRAFLPLAGLTPPAGPDPVTSASLRAYISEIDAALAALSPDQLTRARVAHRAGFADIEQEAEDYVLRFALPNMIFHLTAGYIALKQAGLDLGKADFDALHAYPAGFSWE